LTFLRSSSSARSLASGFRLQYASHAFYGEARKIPICGEKLGAVSYLSFKASSVFAEHLVEKATLCAAATR
jgi:hypothetical protein